MLYADYHFMPTCIPEAEFTRYMREAGLFIDYYTQGRAELSDEAEKIAICAFALAEALYKANQKTIVSEQNDGLRLTYADNTMTAAELNAHKASICRLYLANTGLCERAAGIQGQQTVSSLPEPEA